MTRIEQQGRRSTYTTLQTPCVLNELDNIQNLIYVIRGQRVMLDFDLARMYQVETKYLKRQVRRNIERFEGEDFMFEVTPEVYYSSYKSKSP